MILKIKSLSLFCLIMAALYVNQSKAQKVSVGLRGGLTIPNLTSGGGAEVNPLNEGYSSREGVGFGAFAEFRFSKLFSLQPMIEYSGQGGKKNGFQAFPTPDELAQAFEAQGQTAPTYLYGDFKSKAKINYLMMPILAKFGWNLAKKSPFRVYADAGPFVGLLLNAHQLTTGNSTVYFDAGKTTPVPDGQGGSLTFPFDNDQNIKDQLHKVNFGVEGNVGFSYQFRNKSAVFIEGGGNYGLVNIQKGTENGKNHAGAGTVMLGYAYPL